MITKPLLAATLKPEDIGKIKYPVLCSPKLDGIRALMVDGKLVSRNFKPIPNKFVRSYLENFFVDWLDGFDGELMLRDNSATFQQITSAIMSHEGEPDFVWKIFDRVGSGPEALNIQFCKRLDRLRADEVFNQPNCQLEFVEHELIVSEDQLAAYEEECLLQGYEGVMIRDLYGAYKCGRSTLREGTLMKLKRFNDSEAVITGFEEKETNNNPQEVNELGYAKRSTAKAGKVKAGTLGNFLVKDVKSGIEFKVGSGLTDELRDKIWQDREAYTGKVIKYKSLLIGVKEKPRHPVFLGFRHSDDL